MSVVPIHVLEVPYSPKCYSDCHSPAVVVNYYRSSSMQTAAVQTCQFHRLQIIFNISIGSYDYMLNVVLQESLSPLTVIDLEVAFATLPGTIA